MNPHINRSPSIYRQQVNYQSLIGSLLAVLLFGGNTSRICNKHRAIVIMVLANTAGVGETRRPSSGRSVTLKLLGASEGGDEDEVEGKSRGEILVLHGHNLSR